MTNTRIASAFALVLAIAPVTQAQSAKHPLSLDDIQRIADVRDPQCSPDGNWVAYVVSNIDVREDKSSAHIWQASFDGKSDRQITFGQESESSPRWSPDGKYLAFTSSRPGKARGSQVWLLDRSGGEAFQLTDVKGRLQGYEWSPDSKRLALVIGDPDPDSARPPARPRWRSRRSRAAEDARARSGVPTANGSPSSRATRKSSAPTAWSTSRSPLPTARARPCA